MARCRRPHSRIVMMRKKNLFGSYFQGVGGGRCVKSVGNSYEAGRPGPASVNAGDLASYLTAQGWTATAQNGGVEIEGVFYPDSFLLACDFTSISPLPLRTDVCNGMQDQQQCAGGC